MEKDIEQALSFWRSQNSVSFLYARFEAIQFEGYRKVVVRTGLVIDGRKMIPHSTRHFELVGDQVAVWESGI